MSICLCIHIIYLHNPSNSFFFFKENLRRQKHNSVLLAIASLASPKSQQQFAFLIHNNIYFFTSHYIYIYIYIY